MDSRPQRLHHRKSFRLIFHSRSGFFRAGIFVHKFLKKVQSFVITFNSFYRIM